MRLLHTTFVQRVNYLSSNESKKPHVARKLIPKECCMEYVVLRFSWCFWICFFLLFCLLFIVYYVTLRNNNSVSGFLVTLAFKTTSNFATTVCIPNRVKIYSHYLNCACFCLKIQYAIAHFLHNKKVLF